MVALLTVSQISASAALDLDKEAEHIRRLGVPGVLLFVRNGDRRSIAAAGFADVTTGRRLTGDETWRIASVTKIITGIVVQGLVEENLLSLDDRLSKYLPGIVPLADRITIRQLLNHTSGIPDYLSGDRVPINVSAKTLKKALVRNRPRNLLLTDAKRLPRMFAPGAQHEYSNTNYLVLELLIEHVTERSFTDLVREELIGPLQLKKTGFPDTQGRIPMPNIHGYVPTDGPKGPFSNKKKLLDVTTHDYLHGADGGLYSSIEDLARMMDALWSGAVLTPEQLKTMTTNLKEDHDGMYRYGLGIAAFPTSCRKPVYGHEGRDIGLFTAALATEDGQRQMIIVVNAAPDYVPKLDAAINTLRNRVFCD